MQPNWKIVNPRDSLAFTQALLEQVSDGYVNRDQLIQDLLLWIGEREVELFCRRVLDYNDTSVREDLRQRLRQEIQQRHGL